MSVFLSDVAAVLTRELLRYRRDRAYWFGQIAFPLAFVGFIGLGLNDVVRMPTDTDYRSHLAAGVLALLVGSGGVGGGMALIQDRETGFLRALRVAPVSRAAIVLGKIAARIAVSLVLVLGLVALLAPFTAVGLPHPGALALALCGVTAAFVALGIALASRLRSQESFRMLAALVTVPLYLLSGIFYPVSTLPAVTKALALANPLTYAVDLFRFGLLGVHELPLALDAGLLAGLTAGAVAVAVWVFDRGWD